MGSNKPSDSYVSKDNCDCFSEGHTQKSCPIIQNVTHPLRYYEFTKEEINALEDCDRESFYRRCLPFSAILAAGTYVGIRKRYLERHPHYGIFPKIGVAILLGYIVGRILYVPHCDTKLRKLPEDSYLGNVMRQHELARNPCPKKKL